MILSSIVSAINVETSIKATTVLSTKTSHPRDIATAPTVAFRCPLVAASTTNAAAAPAICCHSAATKEKREAMIEHHTATWLTGLDGNALMSMSEPVLASCSSCQFGNIATEHAATIDRAAAARLDSVSYCHSIESVKSVTHIKPGNTTPVL